MMLFETGIITAPRPSGDVYLRASLESYIHHWDNLVHVFAEPDTPTTFHPTIKSWINHPERLGTIENWWFAMEYMLMYTKADWIMLCEDDIEWRPGSSESIRSYVRNVKQERVGFISPYCSQHNSINPGWAAPRMPVPESWCGALALIFPRKALELIRGKKDEFMAFTRGVHLDSAIGATLLKYNYKLITHTPTLVLHIGDQSTSEPLNENIKRFNTETSHRKPAL